MPYEEQVYNDADMTTLLIYTFINNGYIKASNSYRQDAYICQQGQISIKLKPENPAQGLRIQTCLLHGKNVTLSCALVLEEGMP